MRDLSYKSVPLLLSKLITAIATSQRARDDGANRSRQIDLEDEIVSRGAAALDPLLEALRHHDDPDVSQQLANMIGRIGAADAVIPLAKILANPYAPTIKRSAARALRALQTPDAITAVNIWEGRIAAVRDQLEAYTRENDVEPAMLRRLTTLAEKHATSPRKVAEAWLLLNTTQTLAPDARARLHTLAALSPDDCAYLEGNTSQ